MLQLTHMTCCWQGRLGGGLAHLRKLNRIKCPITDGQVVGQTGGARFETITCDFLRDAFQLMQHLRPGEWIYETQQRISDFDQYEHLARLDDILKENKELASALASDYIITPDIVVARYPVPDTAINQIQQVVGDEPGIACFTPLRAENQPRPFPSSMQVYPANGQSEVIVLRIHEQKL
jgi:hypothetical protein